MASKGPFQPKAFYDSQWSPAAIQLGQRETEEPQQRWAAVAEVPGAQHLLREHHVLLIQQLSATGF